MAVLPRRSAPIRDSEEVEFGAVERYFQAMRSQTLRLRFIASSVRFFVLAALTAVPMSASLHAAGVLGAEVTTATESPTPRTEADAPQKGQTEGQKASEDWPDTPESERGDEGDAPDESAGAKKPEGPYRSPYRLKFSVPESELLFDARTKRGSVAEQSLLPESEWRSERLKHKLGSWGPHPRQFDCPEEVKGKSDDWKRQRVIAAASRFLGYDYQHHHIPDWDPAEGWPWKQVCSGKNGKGVDCSNFSAFNYNWALGIHLSSGIRQQAEQREIPSAGGRVAAKVIARPKGEPDAWYDELARTLKPGDLLYIRTSDMSKVSHVIMWLGSCAEGPDATPLVMDSHGAGIKDANGVAIPCGVHIRPFAKDSWYHRCFDHAHRLVGE
ncbi:MAG: hypothetical protein RIR10_2032 [Planctomycetota bacterium]